MTSDPAMWLDIDGGKAYLPDSEILKDTHICASLVNTNQFKRKKWRSWMSTMVEHEALHLVASAGLR